MSSSRRIGRIGSLTLTAHPSAGISLLALWLILALAGRLWLDLSHTPAVVGGLAASLLHTLSEIAHNLGHARAARRTGYPMIGIKLIGPLGQSIYPKDEPALPSSVHIQRALGGAPASALAALVWGLLALLLSPNGGVVWYVALFACLDNLLDFTLGAFLPLSFTDGGTLMRHWPYRHDA